MSEVYDFEDDLAEPDEDRVRLIRAAFIGRNSIDFFEYDSRCEIELTIGFGKLL